MKTTLQTLTNASTKAIGLKLARRKRNNFATLLMTGILIIQSISLWGQSCVVTISQTPNTAVCAGSPVVLEASSSAINLGTGADGNISVNSTYYTDATRAAVVGTNNSATKKVRVSSTAGFTAGNEVIIITMVDANTSGNLVGQYEFMTIASISGDTLLFTQAHSNTYNASASIKHQVIRVPHFGNVIVTNGGVLTCNSWNGSTGGVICFRSNNNVNINNGGVITAAGKGYRGVSHGAMYRNYNGAQGEGIYGQGYTGGVSNGSNGTWNNANANGGGGGTGLQDAGGGAGGSYGTAGANGVASGSHNGGTAGSTIGSSPMPGLFFGGAGGEGGADEDGASPGNGGNGGGIIYISANSLSLNGNINCNGNNGGSGSNSGGGSGCGMAGGGAGAGGSIYLSLNAFSGTGANITSVGGTGGATNGCGGTGGNGGYGRSRINMPTVIPTTNPVSFFGNLPSMNGVTYLWSNGATTSSISVSPAITTNYSVVITSTTGCNGTGANKTVSVNPLPSINVSGNTPVCSGKSLTLTANGTDSYVWTGGINNGVAFVPISSSSYTVTATNTVTGCNNTAVINTTVNSNPTITVTGGTICKGQSFTLSPNGASTYTFSNGQIVNPSVTSSYTVSGTSAQGCVGQDAVAIVVVNANPTITVAGGTICDGQSFTLSPNGASTYTFSNGAVVSPSVTTSYTISGTSAQGCVGQDAVATVVVNANPTITVAGGTICDGQSFTLSPNGASTYTFSNGAVVSPSVTTSYTISGTSAQGCVGQDAVATVVVNANPTITVAGGAICDGQSFTLSPNGASTYTFSNGAVVSPSVTSSYTVSGTSAQGCVGQDAVATVVVNANPTITVAGGAICIGQSFTLSPNGASTYTFSNGAVISPTVTSSYTVSGTSTQGCLGNDAVVTVTVNALPQLTLSASLYKACVNQNTIALNAMPTGGNFSGINVNGASFNPASTGTFNPVYSYTDTNTGCSDSISISITVDVCLGFNKIENENHNINLYPNPNNGVFTLQSDNNLVKKVNVIDVTGRVVLTQNSEESSMTFNISDLASGIYYVSINSNNNTQVIKVIKN